MNFRIFYAMFKSLNTTSKSNILKKRLSKKTMIFGIEKNMSDR